MDALTVTYSGVSLPYISVTAGMNLQTILQNINTAINNSSSAPDYSGYNLYCVTQTDGTSHPTNTQNFSEGISKILCALQTAYNTFTTTTYTTAISTLTTSINGILSPALTYVPFAITSADSLATVYSKLFSGFNSFGFNTSTSTFDPFTSNWSTLSISPSHSTITTWNNVIAYLSTLTTTVSGKQASIGTFNNSGNCLSTIGGTSADSLTTTIGLLTTFTCSLSSSAFNAGSITWGCVSSQSNLQNSIQALVSSISSVINNYVAGAGTGLAISTIGSCLGKSLAIDTTYTQLYKVMLSSDAYTNAGFLNNKVTSSDSSITIAISGNLLNFTVTTPVDHKVMVNSSDPTPGYLIDKIPSLAGNWGLSIIIGPSSNNTQLILTPSVTNPSLFVQNLISTISEDSALLSQWCNLMATCSACTCNSATDLSVVVSGAAFDATWTAGSGVATQTFQYRIKTTGTWVSNTGINPSNPMSGSNQTATITGLSSNTVYQFQVLSNCCGTTTAISNTEEGIIYAKVNLTTGVASGVISGSQTTMSSVQIVEFNLYNINTSTIIQTVNATGTNPTVAFTSVGSGAYSIKYRYGTMINSSLLYSDDPSQSGALYATGTITVP